MHTSKHVLSSMCTVHSVHTVYTVYIVCTVPNTHEVQGVQMHSIGWFNYLGRSDKVRMQTHTHRDVNWCRDCKGGVNADISGSQIDVSGCTLGWCECSLFWKLHKAWAVSDRCYSTAKVMGWMRLSGSPINVSGCTLWCIFERWCLHRC